MRKNGMDQTDILLIGQLQRQTDIALSELSRRLNISKTTCWNRLQRMEEQGIIKNRYIEFDREKLGLPVVIFLSITVGQHSSDWVEKFTSIVQAFPEIVEVHRLTGEGADYQLKVICPDIKAYDQFQQKLIHEVTFTSMSTRISLMEIKHTQHLPLAHLHSKKAPS
jgi:Lrp/AsnC family transcriptional regulator